MTGDESSEPTPPPIASTGIAETSQLAGAKPQAAAEASDEISGEADDRPGVEHDPQKKWTVYQLGLCVAGLALASLYPAVMEVVGHFRDFDSPGVEPWAYLVFFIAAVQLVYALYLVQLPDWSTVWVVMIVAAMTSTFYAGGTGISLMARDDNEIIGVLGLSQLHASGRLLLWCLMMTTLWSLLTYFFARFSLRWHKAFELATAGTEE